MWGKQSTFENLEIGLRTADPIDGCEPYNFKEPRRPTAYLVTGIKSCPLLNLIHNAQAHGAKALFIVNNKDEDIENISIPDHMPGVQIHIFIVSQNDGAALIDVTNRAKEDDENWHTRSRIEIDFMAYVKRKKTVQIEMIYSPDQHSAMKFLADVAESSFDGILDDGIEINLGIAMMTCEKCKEKGYKTPMPNCLSGGRYCWKAETEKTQGGEVVLIQAIKNLCVNTILSIKERRHEMGDYYWLFYKNCMEDFRPECSNKILSKMGIKEDVFKCITTSFYRTVQKEDHNLQMKHPNIFLQDNFLLKMEKQRFNKVEHYAHFPLVKINDVMYYGPISFSSIFGFICNHINDELEGCKQFITEEEKTIHRNNRLFEASILSLIVLLCLASAFVCRKKLKRKFDTDLAYKVEQSVTEYLQKNPGTEL